MLGTIQDLSEPLASSGKAARNGMLLRVDELNVQGSIQGRTLVLQVEDSGQDPRRAPHAAHKRVNQDGIFAMVGPIGTAQNLVAIPVQMPKGVANFMPPSAAREMYDPPHPPGNPGTAG